MPEENKRWFVVLAPAAHLEVRHAKSANTRRSHRRERVYIKLWVWAEDANEVSFKCVTKQVRGITNHHDVEIFPLDDAENDWVKQRVKYYDRIGELPESVAYEQFFCDYLNLEKEYALHYIKDKLQYYVEQKLRESKKK